MEIAIVGGGIVGLGLALSLHQRGLTCRVYNLDDYITQDELRALSDPYSRVAGYSIDELGQPSPA
jgi:2-polyprenyl-6-methoxyphenol hydroxylase-like FAD-dependent oxidoreductase